MTNYTKEDFLKTSKPYDFVAEATDPYEAERRLKAIHQNAQAVGVKRLADIMRTRSKNDRQEAVARKIALLLAESKANIQEIDYIFMLAKSCLYVSFSDDTESSELEIESR